MFQFEFAMAIWENYLEKRCLSIDDNEYEHMNEHILKRLRVATHASAGIFHRPRQLVIAHLEQIHLRSFFVRSVVVAV